MFDPFFLWVESTALREWIVGSPSLLAFPGILTAHTVGMGLLAGLNIALDLRLLGAARGMPVHALLRVMPLLWAALVVNIVTGILLLIGYPTKALTNPLFYAKLALIAVAMVILRATLRDVRAARPVSRRLHVLATTSIVVWVAAITAGKLLAYTCTRLSLHLPC